MSVSRRSTGALCLSALLALAGAATAQDARDWPGWGGPSRDFIVADGGVFPSSSYRLQVAWKRPLGTGYSAVSVVGDTAVTLFADGDFEYAGAFDVATGEERWRARLAERFPGRYGSIDGPISTPLIADGRVFALDPAGRFFALDLASGEQLWMHDLEEGFGAARPFYGFATAPIAWRGSVIVQTGAEGSSAVTAFEAATGRTLWRTENEPTGYQSPTLARLGGAATLMVPGNRRLLGIEPDSGRLLWALDHEGDGSYWGSKSGLLVPVDAGRFFLKTGGAKGLLIEAAGEAGTSPATGWTTDQLRYHYGPPVFHGGYLFGYNRSILTCVDAATGKRVWRSRPPGDGFPIVVDGRLVIATKDGSLRVARASAEGYEEEARLDLFEDLTWAPPSFAGGSLFARSHGELARIDVVADSPGALVAEDEVPGVLPETEFGRFVASLAEAEDPAREMDAYLSAQTRIPIVEGDRIVHFVYRGPGREVEIEGDLFGYDNDQPMNHVPGTDVFYFSMRLEPGTRVTYSFVRDFEEPIPLDPLNPSTIVVEGNPYVTTPREASVLELPGWVAPRHLDAPADRPRGRLEELTVESAAVERALVLKVYLPAGYDDSEERLPVVYVLDGEPALELGRMLATLDNVIGESVEPVVAVFVPFFAGSLRQSTFEGYVGTRRESYARALVEEVVPAVDARYRTRASEQSRAILGRALSAFGAVYAATRHPGTFGKLGLQSIWWEPGSEEENRAMIPPAAERALTVYLDWGRYDLRAPFEGWDFVSGNRRFAEALREKGHTSAGGEAPAGYGWGSWRTRTDRMLQALFPLRAGSGDGPG